MFIAPRLSSEKCDGRSSQHQDCRVDRCRPGALHRLIDAFWNLLRLDDTYGGRGSGGAVRVGVGAGGEAGVDGINQIASPTAVAATAMIGAASHHLLQRFLGLGGAGFSTGVGGISAGPSDSGFISITSAADPGGSGGSSLAGFEDGGLMTVAGASSNFCRQSTATVGAAGSAAG